MKTIWTNLAAYMNVIMDIAIVSYIVYHVLVLLRGTRAVSLLRGIVVITVVWLLSNFLHLSTSRWLIENFLSVGLVAIIVIFQPELRRALEQLGRGEFLSRGRYGSEGATTKVIGEITDAVAHLAERNIGALIAIERKTGLTNYVETGIEIEGKLSSELIKNIFLPHSNLHDGAVIIRNDTIVAAGCLFPLSDAPTLNIELGTRHRAGLGMSELSDAIIIIVSEQTGLISLATHGVLERSLSYEELLNRLFKALNPQPSKFSSLGFYRRGGSDK